MSMSTRSRLRFAGLLASKSPTRRAPLAALALGLLWSPARAADADAPATAASAAAPKPADDDDGGVLLCCADGGSWPGDARWQGGLLATTRAVSVAEYAGYDGVQWVRRMPAALPN